MIQPGQIYRSCDPRGGPRIRIERYTPGAARAHIVDALTGKRFRQILVKDLHESPVTATGRRRRSGYVLDRHTPEAPPEDPSAPRSVAQAPGGELPGRDGSLRERVAAAVDRVFEAWESGLGEQRPQDALTEAVLSVRDREMDRMRILVAASESPGHAVRMAADYADRAIDSGQRAEQAEAALARVRAAVASFDGRGVIAPGHVNLDIPTAGEVLDVVRAALDEQTTI